LTNSVYLASSQLNLSIQWTRYSTVHFYVDCSHSFLWTRLSIYVLLVGEPFVKREDLINQLNLFCFVSVPNQDMDFKHQMSCLFLCLVSWAERWLFTLLILVELFTNSVSFHNFHSFLCIDHCRIGKKEELVSWIYNFTLLASLYIDMYQQIYIGYVS